jgi:hypothetical protein
MISPHRRPENADRGGGRGTSGCWKAGTIRRLNRAPHPPGAFAAQAASTATAEGLQESAGATAATQDPTAPAR